MSKTAKKTQKAGPKVQASATIDTEAPAAVTSLAKKIDAYLAEHDLLDTPAVRRFAEQVLGKSEDETYARQASAFGQSLQKRGQTVPGWIGSMPSEKARTDADRLLETEFFPDVKEARDLLELVRTLLTSAEGAIILGDHYPWVEERAPRLGFASADFISSNRSLQIDGEPWVEYCCYLTEKKFVLPKGAPVPALFVDWYRGGEPYEASALHSESKIRNYVIHPALAEAGPATVLWAVWWHIELELGRACERMGSAISLLFVALGDPEDVGFMPPATAYRTWKRQSGDPTFAKVATGWKSLERN